MLSLSHGTLVSWYSCLMVLLSHGTLVSWYSMRFVQRRAVPRARTAAPFERRGRKLEKGNLTISQAFLFSRILDQPLVFLVCG